MKITKYQRDMMRQFAREIQHLEAIYKQHPVSPKSADSDLDRKINEYLPKILKLEKNV